MTLKTRRIILIVFILLFLISAPLLLFYSLGYRLNLDRWELSKTGSILAVSQPRGATLYLNGEKLSETTPAYLNQLTPGEYTIKLEKMGYSSWERKVVVQSGQTYFAEGLIMFPTDDPEQQMDQKIGWIDFSPKNKFALFTISKDKTAPLYLLDLDNAKTTLLSDDFVVEKGIKTLWSDSNTKCLLTSGNSTFLISAFWNYTAEDISALFNEYKFEKIKWAKNSTTQLTALSTNKVYLIDTFLEKNATAEIIFQYPKTKLISDFTLEGKNLYILTDSNKNTLVEKFSIAKKSEVILPETELTIDSCAKPLFSGTFLNNKVIKCDNNSFYFVEKDLKNIRLEEKDYTRISTHEYEAKTAMFTENKIQTIEQPTGTWSFYKITLPDISITDLRWHNSPEYVFISDKGVIKAVETDSGYSVTLTEGGVTAFSANTDSTVLYFVKDGLLWRKTLYQSLFF